MRDHNNDIMAPSLLPTATKTTELGGLTDSFGRRITYLRLSLTDRCDLRCHYCMAEKMVFLPKKDVLTLEELSAIADAFIARGVRKIRLTGGEPMVRKGFMTLVDYLGYHQSKGRLDEFTLTTNATLLSKYAKDLYKAGMRRINVSLDSLDSETFSSITRGGDLSKVLDGIATAQEIGLKIKLNTVALKNDNADQIPDMIAWAHKRDIGISLIEIMPLGDTGKDRNDQFIPLSAIKDKMAERWKLTDTSVNTGGPSRYTRLEETGGLVGFISPLTQNFCASCNRVRVSCTGKLFMCLGQNDQLDLKTILRTHGPTGLNDALDLAMIKKPERHNFEIKKGDATPPKIARHMSETGG